MSLMRFTIRGVGTQETAPKIEAAAGTPASDQYLAFGGKMLEDGHALSEYNITKESSLQLGVPAQGGSGPWYYGTSEGNNWWDWANFP